MDLKSVKSNGVDIAVIKSESPVIFDVQSSLDLFMNIKYETGSGNIAINKEAFTDEFYILSTCLAGEILQKLINYGFKIAIYGDFSEYTSASLKDFIRECNKGNSIFFQDDCNHAIDKLSKIY